MKENKFILETFSYKEYGCYGVAVTFNGKELVFFGNSPGNIGELRAIAFIEGYCKALNIEPVFSVIRHVE